MRPTAKLLLALCLFCSAQPAPAQTKDAISGTWNGYIGRSEADPSAVTMNIKRGTDGKLVGTVAGPKLMPGDIKGGSFDAATGALKLIVLVRSASGDKGGEVAFEGRVANDTASGTMVLGGQTGMFKMTKGEAHPGMAIFGGKGASVVAEDAASAAARRGFVEVSGWILRAAEMVPAEKYSYRPVSTVRTFGELVAHVVDGSNYYCSNGAGKKVEWSDATEKKVSGKTAIVAALKQAFAECKSAYDGGKQIAPLMENVSHSNLHYGNIVTYLRMMGMVPPST